MQDEAYVDYTSIRDLTFVDEEQSFAILRCFTTSSWHLLSLHQILRALRLTVQKFRRQSHHQPTQANERIKEGKGPDLCTIRFFILFKLSYNFSFTVCKLINSAN